MERWRVEVGKMRSIAERARSPLRDYGLMALRHASRVMNDRGVYLEERARPEDAIRAYSSALVADGSNLVASVNLSRVVRSLGRMEAERIDRDLTRFLEDMPGPVDIVSMTPVYGRLRDPAAAAEQGRRLAGAGRFSEAVAELIEAMAIGGTNDTVAAAAARALASQGRFDEGRRVLETARTSFPDSPALRDVESHIALLSGTPDRTDSADGPGAREHREARFSRRGRGAERDSGVEADPYRSRGIVRICRTPSRPARTGPFGGGPTA
jgi:tetratricopeptide (TPR) repeat protein